MILGACPFQMGYPRKITSYASMSSTLPEMAGLASGSRPSTWERLLELV